LVVTSTKLLKLREWARSALEAYALLGIVLVPLSSIGPLIELAQKWSLRDAVFGLVWSIGQVIAISVFFVLVRSDSTREAVRTDRVST